MRNGGQGGGHNVRRANQYYGAAQVYERYGDGGGDCVRAWADGGSTT